MRDLVTVLLLAALIVVLAAMSRIERPARVEVINSGNTILIVRPLPTPAATAAGEQHDTDSFTARSADPARRGSTISLLAGPREGTAFSHGADAGAGREQL